METHITKSDKEEIISRLTDNITEVVTTAITLQVIPIIDNLAEAAAKGFGQVHDGIDTLESRFDGLESRFDRLEAKVDNLKNDMNFNFAKVHQEIFSMKVTNNLE